MWYFWMEVDGVEVADSCFPALRQMLMPQYDERQALSFVVAGNRCKKNRWSERRGRRRCLSRLPYCCRRCRLLFYRTYLGVPAVSSVVVVVGVGGEGLKMSMLC
jgi:hypothetical protein